MASCPFYIKTLTRELHRVGSVRRILDSVRSVLNGVRSVLNRDSGVVDNVLNGSVVGVLSGLLTTSGEGEQASRSKNDSDLLHLLGSQ